MFRRWYRAFWSWVFDRLNVLFYSYSWGGYGRLPRPLNRWRSFAWRRSQYCANLKKIEEANPDAFAR